MPIVFVGSRLRLCAVSQQKFCANMLGLLDPDYYLDVLEFQSCEQEIEVLLEQLYSSASKVDLTFGLPDLSSALKQIQSQYDSIAAKNLQVRGENYAFVQID